MYKTLQEYFSDPKRWTRGFSWRDSYGNGCSKEQAACACLYGAIDIVYPDRTDEIAERLREIGERLFDTKTLTKINDELGYDAVMELIKEANV